MAYLPLHYVGGDLMLNGSTDPEIDIFDGCGKKYCIHSVEWLLRHVAFFEAGINQTRLLMDAASHYGLGAHSLMGADLDRISDAWDVLDAAGRAWLKQVPHREAVEAGERLKLRPHWIGDVCIRLSRNDSKDDWRHEGPLILLHHNLGVTTFTGVAVRSHVGRCGMMLEEVLRRFDQFSATDQAELMAGLAKHFDLGQEETAGAA